MTTTVRIEQIPFGYSIKRVSETEKAAKNKPPVGPTSIPNASTPANFPMKSSSDGASASEMKLPSTNETSLSTRKMPCVNVACPNPGAETKRCARCLSSSAVYCSVPCQKLDWNLTHKERCFPPSSLNVAAITELLEQGPLNYIQALNALCTIQAFPACTERTPAELSSARELEYELRNVIRPRHFPKESLYKNPRLIFRGDGDSGRTWHLTLQQAIDWMPVSSRPQLGGSFTEENPMVMFWLGARDGNDADADFTAVSRVLRVPTLLYLIGPPPYSGRPGLSSKREMRYDQLRVRRVIGLYPSSQTEDLPNPHFVCAFNAGLDIRFENWAPAITRLIDLNVPAVFTGYSHDDSYYQDELILRTLGANIVVPTRRSTHGFDLGVISNFTITVMHGLEEGTVVFTDWKQQKMQCDRVRDELEARGLQIPLPDSFEHANSLELDRICKKKVLKAKK